MTAMIRCLSLTILAAAVLASTASAAGSDPRKCSTATPGGTPKHAYWCAHNAAVADVRAKMAVLQHQGRWYAPTYCTQKQTVLAWSCNTILGGHIWDATVLFHGTSAGWLTTVSVKERT